VVAAIQDFKNGTYAATYTLSSSGHYSTCALFLSSFLVTHSNSPTF